MMITMGFQLEQISDGKSVIRATQGGNDAADFLAAVRDALSKNLLDLSIDVTIRPSVFGEILPSALKLQGMLAKHGRRLKIIGLPGDPSNPFIQKLNAAGFEVQSSGAMAAPPSSVSPENQPLPPPKEMQERLTRLRHEISALLQKKERLEAEQSLYRQRDRDLDPGHGSSGGMEKLRELDRLEKTLLDLRSQNSGLQKNNEELAQRKKTAEEDFQGYVGKLKTEMKAKEGEAKKKIDQLKADLKKAQGEYDRRAKLRAAELARLQSTQPKG